LGAKEAEELGGWVAPPTYVKQVFFVVTALYWLSLYFYVPILAPYVEYSGGTLEMVGLVVSAYGLAQLILRIPLGMWSDRLGNRRPFLALGFLANVASCLVFVSVTEPWLMVVGRLLAGVGACAWVAFSVLFASYFPPGQAARAMSYIIFCNSTSVMAATFTGGWLADQSGWLAPFWLSAGVGVLGLVGVAFVYERPAVLRETASIGARLRSVIAYPEVVFASLVAALGQYVTFATHFGFLPNYAVSIGASKTELGIMTMLGMLSIAAITLISGSNVTVFQEGDWVYYGGHGGHMGWKLCDEDGLLGSCRIL
jgi:MFS family permease